jgi:protein TonB
MFDLISGGPRHPFHDPTVAPTLISIVVHSAIVLGVFVIPAMYMTDTLPAVPSMLAFVADQPAPPPPPPPPPPPARAKAHEASVRPAPTASAFAAPVEAPGEIRPEPSEDFDESIGVVGGIEGGLIGGTIGGIVGGLVAAQPLPPPPPPPPPPAPGAPVRIGGQILAPALATRIEPKYPEIAILAHVTGMVILEATVAADGTVESVRVLRSVKFLDQAAIDAVKQWRYSPLVLNGIPTPFVLTVTLSFNLKEG